MRAVAKLKKKLYFVVARYFRWWANFSLKRWRPRVIAITGSAGKTKMLHLVEHLMKGRAHYSHNANSAYGLAFDLVGMRGITGSKLRWVWLFIAVPIKSLFFRHHEEYYVVEIDGERPREAEFLAQWLKPEVTMWVSIGLSHAVQFQEQVYDGIFDSLEAAITQEFASIPKHTSDLILIDGDSDLMASAVRQTKAKVIAVRREEIKRYAVSLNRTSFSTENCTIQFSHPEPRNIGIQILMLKKLAKYIGEELCRDFTCCEMPPGRSAYFKGKIGKREINLVDSSYNAHLISMETILEMAKELKVKPKWLVIGDMVEQGLIEADEHTKLAGSIIKAKPDFVILIGSRVKKYTLPELKNAGIDAVHCEDAKEALKLISRKAKGGETLIFKGSQYLEWIIEKLLADPEDAKRLPRREPAAIKRRKQRGLD